MHACDLRFLARTGIAAAAVVGLLAALPANSPPPVACAAPVDAGGPATPVAICFAPGTPESEMARWYDLLNPPGQRYNVGQRWPGELGTPTELTWSLVPDGTLIRYDTNGDGTAEEFPSTLFARMDATFAGDRALWTRLIRESFERWADLTGTQYRFVNNGVDDWDDGAAWNTPGNGLTRGDVRIWMTLVDGASGILAFNFYPGSGVGGDMVLDYGENWKANVNRDYRFLRNIVTHEHGHGLGIAHVCPTVGESLMEPYLNRSYYGPQHDDIRAAQRLYGDAFEENDTAATATDVGVLTISTPLRPGTISFEAPALASRIGIDGAGDIDYYRFSLEEPRFVSATVTPLGRIYDSSTQNPDGTCNNGNLIDSRSKADLALQILDQDGLTVLAVGDAAPIGESESAGAVSAGPGDYFVAVYPSDAPAETQLYQLLIRAETRACATDLDGDGVVAAGDLAQLLTAYGRSAAGDLDDDGDTDNDDLDILLIAFGVRCAA